MTAALNRFISRSTDRCRPFFLLINRWKNFEWTKECAEAIQQLKDYLARLLIMSSLEPDEVLFAYIVVDSYAVSLVLIRVDNGVQWPVYYVSSRCMKRKCVIYHWKKLSWQWCLARVSCLIISKRIQWWFLHNSH